MEKIISFFIVEKVLDTIYDKLYKQICQQLLLNKVTFCGHDGC